MKTSCSFHNKSKAAGWSPHLESGVVAMVTSLAAGLSVMSVGGFRWYRRGCTCSPFLPSACSPAGGLTGSSYV